jgi:hypothetical protein
MAELKVPGFRFQVPGIDSASVRVDAENLKPET